VNKEAIGIRSPDGPKPKFQVGDKVKTHDPKLTEVWEVGDWDEHLKDRRYQVMNPETRKKLWVNEKGMKKASVVAGDVGTQIVGLDVQELLTLLNAAYADEWLAYYQYWIGAKVIVGPMRMQVESELIQHAKDEEEHAGLIADRIVQLGGTPILSPEEWFDVGECGFAAPVDSSVRAVLDQNINGERCAIQFYQDLLNFVRGKDDVTFDLIQDILKDEVEHEDDLQMIAEDMDGGMNKVATELVKIAKSLISIDFATKDQMDKYLKDHPKADRSNHKVVENKGEGSKRKFGPAEADKWLKKDLPEIKNRGKNKAKVDSFFNKMKGELKLKEDSSASDVLQGLTDYFKSNGKTKGHKLLKDHGVTVDDIKEYAGIKKDKPVKPDAPKKAPKSDEFKPDSFKENIRTFAFDTFHDDDQGNYSDANELMESVEKEETVEGMVSVMKDWGVKKKEMKVFLDSYLKENESDEEWAPKNQKLMDLFDGKK
jgi:bacterioferritin